MVGKQRLTAVFRDLEKAVGYVFRDEGLLTTALTHGSRERPVSSATNERLEFLGDTVLNLVVVRHLYDRYPDSDEGDLSKMKAILVSGKSAARAALGR